jgi:hypothetical protein
VRTTVTLDPDVAAKLKQVARERGVSFKVTLNEAVRAGLNGQAATGQAYSMPTRRMGVKPVIDLDHALRLAGALEDAELIRRQELRK